MKKLIIILMLAATVTVTLAQDTAYVSKGKTTSLVFPVPVKIIGKVPAWLDVLQKESTLITFRAKKVNSSAAYLSVREISTEKTYHIQVMYSYGRAGRRIEIGEPAPTVVRVIKSAEYNYSTIASDLAAGKRKNIIDHKKISGVKVWVNKLSLAGNKIFFRLDIRNKSNLPYDVDFIRFYIRDLRTVARMATHEQEIVPVLFFLA